MATTLITDNESDVLFVLIDTINNEKCEHKTYAIVSEASFIAINDNSIKKPGLNCQCFANRIVKPVSCKCIRLKLSATFLSALLYELHRSRAFRTNVMANLVHNVRFNRAAFDCDEKPVTKHLLVKVDVEFRGYGWLDLSWNNKLERLFIENVELENTMAWLSTLGGAYSSLGDEFVDHAKTAGIISGHQYRLAAKLGDVVILSKCKLYLALSLLQLGYLQKAKGLIREQYEMACSLPPTKRDVRLENMCKGAWAKLQYAYVLRKKSRKQLINNNNNDEILSQC